MALLGPTLHSTKTDDKGEFRFAAAGPTYDLVAIEQRGTDPMDVVVFRGLRRRDPTVSLEPNREARELGDERPYSTATIDHPSSREMICRTSFVAKSPHGMPDWFSSTVQWPGHAPLRGTAASVCQRLGAQSEFLFAREELSLSARQPAALPLSLYKPLATRQLAAALTVPNGMRRDTLESFMRLAPGVWLQIDAALEDETTIIAPRDPQANLIVRASAVGRGLVTRGWREVSNADTVAFALPAPPAPEMPPSGDVDVLPGTRFAWSAGPRGPYRVEIELNYRASGQLDGELLIKSQPFIRKLVIHTAALAEALPDLSRLNARLMPAAPHTWRVEQEVDVATLDDLVAPSPPLIDLPEPTRLGSGKQGWPFITR